MRQSSQVFLVLRNNSKLADFAPNYLVVSLILYRRTQPHFLVFQTSWTDLGKLLWTVFSPNRGPATTMNPDLTNPKLYLQVSPYTTSPFGSHQIFRSGNQSHRAFQKFCLFCCLWLGAVWHIFARVCWGGRHRSISRAEKKYHWQNWCKECRRGC